MDPQLLQAVQSIAQSLQPHFWPKSLTELVQLALIPLTVWTLCYLKKYTDETVKLRKAARDQVEATLMPIVVLTTAEDEKKFLVRNAGKGPAFNVEIRSFSAGRSPKLLFHHRSVIAAGEEHDAILRIDSKPYGPGEFVNFVRQGYPDSEFPTTICYQGIAKGYWYQTSHTIRFTEGKYDLIIQFDGLDRLDRRPE